jgi:hypothetical protein
MKGLAWILSWGLLGASGQIITFDSDAIGKLPPGWTVPAAAPESAAKWEVLKDGSAPTQPYVFAQVSRGEPNRPPIAIFNRVALRDGEISVRIKPVSGTEDQSGGLVWRYRDEKNYYVVRADALDNTIAAFKVVNGKRIALLPRSLKHEIPSQSWSILKVSARGARFAIYVNHRRLLQFDDNTFRTAGKVGLWTNADSVTYFDDFRVYPK